MVLAVQRLQNGFVAGEGEAHKLLPETGPPDWELDPLLALPPGQLHQLDPGLCKRRFGAGSICVLLNQIGPAPRNEQSIYSQKGLGQPFLRPGVFYGYHPRSRRFNVLHLGMAQL